MKKLLSVNICLMLVMSFLFSCNLFSEEKSLIGYWPLDEGNGSIAFDLSPKQNNGRIFGATWTKDEKGIPVLEFDGLDDYISIPHQDYLNVNDELTIELWANLKTTERTPVFISKDAGGDGAAGYYIWQPSWNKGEFFYFRIFTEREGKFSTQNVMFSIKEQGIIPGNWFYIASTFSSSKKKTCFYLNGEKVDEKEIPEGTKIRYLKENNPVVIGGLSRCPVHTFNFEGYLREVKMYERVLNDEEIKQSYQKNIKIKEIKPIPSSKTLEANLPCRIKVKIIDSDTGELLNAKVWIKNLKENKGYYPSDSFAYGVRGNNSFFYAFGNFDLKLPSGKTEIWVTNGFEYIPEQTIVELEEKEEKEITIKLKRIIDLPKLGWYCGEDELQYSDAHGKGKYYPAFTKDPSNPAKISQAEGLNWVHFVHRPEDNEVLSKLTTDRFIAINGVESYNRLGGDIILITAENFSPKHNLFDQIEAIDSILQQGKVIDIADTSTLKGVKEPVLRCQGRGIPVLVALGKANLMHEGFIDAELREEVSYRFLNLGFKFAAGAGTDMYMTNPAESIAPGWNRAYLKLDKLSWDEVIKAYKQQRIFTTTGPLLLFGIQNKLPGDTIYLSGKNKEKLLVKIEAYHIYGIEKVEIVKNGQVIKTLLPQEGKIIEEFPMEIEETCWIAARAYGKKGKFFGTFAHTSPIYIQFGNEPIKPKKEDIDYFIQWLEDYKECIKGIADKYGYKPESYQPLYKLIDESKNVYKSLFEKPRNWEKTKVIEAPQNLINNPGFESNFDGWSNLKTDIKSYEFKVSIDDKIYHSGCKSVSIEYLSGPEDGYTWFDQSNISLKKGRSYRLSVYVKTLDVTRNGSIHLHWPGNIRFYEYKIDVKGTSDWNKYDFYFIAPAETCSLALVFAGKGKIWFDDIEITESPLPKGLLVEEGIVFTYKPRYEKEDTPITPTPEETKRGYITYLRNNPRDTYHNSIPKREEITNKLNIITTPGEYEPAWFSLYTLKELKEVKVKILDDLKNEKGKIIPKDNIELRVVKYWAQRISWASITYYIIPELLEKKESVDIPKNNTQSFWLTIKVPEEVEPGNYSTKISVEPKGEKNTILTLNLKVLPFKLKSPDNKYWVMWTDDRSYDKMSKEEIRIQLLDMKNHGINTVLFYPPGFKDCKFKKEGEKIIFSSEKLSQIQEIRKELKINGPLLLYWGGELERYAGKLIGVKDTSDNKIPLEINNPSYKQTVKEAFKAVDRFIKETGGQEYSDWYYLGMDEPGSHQERQSRALLEYSLAKESGIKSLITINEGEFAEKIMPYITGMMWAGGPKSEEINNARKQREVEYWWYGSGCYTGQEGGLMPNRYLCGFLFYKSCAKGQTSWVYTRLGVTGDPYNDFDGINFSEPKDAFIVYPPKKEGEEYVPTLQWEGIREGIDDYKYIYTLQEFIKEAKNSHKEKMRVLGEKVENKLNLLLDSIPWNKTWNEDDVMDKFDNYQAGKIRKSIINLIMELMEINHDRY